MLKCRWLVMCFIHYHQASDGVTKQYADVLSLIGGMFLEASSSFCLFLCVPKKQSVMLFHLTAVVSSCCSCKERSKHYFLGLFIFLLLESECCKNLCSEGLPCSGQDVFMRTVQSRGGVKYLSGVRT